MHHWYIILQKNAISAYLPDFQEDSFPHARNIVQNEMQKMEVGDILLFA
jgi:hypothetical protein